MRSLSLQAIQPNPLLNNMTACIAEMHVKQLQESASRNIQQARWILALPNFSAAFLHRVFYMKITPAICLRQTEILVGCQRVITVKLRPSLVRLAL
jgi:hypothetical protein